MKISEIISIIEDFAPLEIQESWDNSGLIIGSAEEELKAVLLAFDCTPDLLEEAISIDANLIITHHPLIFKGLRKITPRQIEYEMIVKAISSGISIYAAHTNADKVLEGVSGAMARRLELEDVKILRPEKFNLSKQRGTINLPLDLCESSPLDVGLGAIGTWSKPKTFHAAVDFVKQKFNLKQLKTSKPIESAISRVAVCGGSGSSMIEDAISSKAQLYISADISYHNFFTPKDFMLMDIGHFESEVEIVHILFSLLRKKIPNFAVSISKNLHSSNPILYF